MIDDEYAQIIPLNNDGTNKLNKKAVVGHKDNYNSPLQLREMGHSQQMVPNQMKQ
jgi:hypothetical protein